MSNIADSLSSPERRILPLLKNNISLKELTELSKLQEVEVMRALQWLENKNLLKINKQVKEIIFIDENGKKYLKDGLPEWKFLNSLTKELTLKEIQDITKLNKDEINISLGILKKRLAIEFKNNKLSLTKHGKNLLNKESLEYNFLKKLPLDPQKLTDEQRFAYHELKNRKNIIKTDVIKEVTVTLTKQGEEIQKQKIDFTLIDSLTPKILKQGSWKNKKFRRYDIKINVPKIYPGKRHFVAQALNYAKRIWLDMGFKEMKGTIINSSFWNFDALFTAQDHPVRDLQDTFYLKNKGKLPEQKLVNKVKAVHENGGDTKSKGWDYKWDPEEAKKLVLRTHTTVLSAQTLAKLKKEDLPAKFFAIGKCFRNETVDYSHLFEFNQTEGIVVDENANFRHLIGYLKEFFKKMGFPKARFRPAYFPYTENSIEIDVYHPVHKKWVELGGAGMFRPEVVIPLLGKDIPVLAWGPGIDRIITMAYDIKDIRELYKNDLKQLREIKSWVK
ncbi:MAG: phenylalanine--tRNA ligase subunit alpha [Nanoarchaeota archaeon]|nr:phenylalanine--tRNA ligase subunit alpha [Nanoarchaeota archaeon]